MLPAWFKQEIPRNIELIKNRIKKFENLRLNTVCKSARCPNLSSCFENNSVTFMIMGDVCGRGCSFCAVSKGRAGPLDISEPYNLALAIREIGLDYVVITSVTRDDLPLGGASQYARAVYLIKQHNPKSRVELLVPDFNNFISALSLAVKSAPDVIAHNLETVEWLYPSVRPRANYRRSLNVIRNIKELGFAGFTKSGIMLGFGESQADVIKAISDLKNSSCDILTLGQYLSPSNAHIPVEEYISPEKFSFYREEALAMGFKAVYSGPLVRSSYKAKEVYSDGCV